MLFLQIIVIFIFLTCCSFSKKIDQNSFRAIEIGDKIKDRIFQLLNCSDETLINFYSFSDNTAFKGDGRYHVKFNIFSAENEFKFDSIYECHYKATSNNSKKTEIFLFNHPAEHLYCFRKNDKVQHFYN